MEVRDSFVEDMNDLDLGCKFQLSQLVDRQIVDEGHLFGTRSRPNEVVPGHILRSLL